MLDVASISTTPHRHSPLRRSLAQGVAVLPFLALVLFASLPASAASFVVDPVQSQLQVSDASLQSLLVAGFVTDIVPTPGTDFTRSVSGHVDVDIASGAVQSGIVTFLGAPLIAEQLFPRPGRSPLDVGDLVLTSLAIAFDAQGGAMLGSGFIQFDLSTGATRLRVPNPTDLSGRSRSFMNTAGPPMLTQLGGVTRLVLPVLVTIDDLDVVGAGVGRLTVSGEIVASLPEPGTGGMLGFGLLALLLAGTGRRRPRQLALCCLIVPLLGPTLVACELNAYPDDGENDFSDGLAMVLAVDDSATTGEGQSVDLFVLANDAQDQDIVEMVSAPIPLGDLEIVESVGPDFVVFRPPVGFTGTHQFQYMIQGGGADFDATSSSTATVTVEVTAGLPAVDAVDDLATTTVNQPVTVDVLLNDSQDTEQVESFMDAISETGELQPGSVIRVVASGVEMLEYLPPAGFTGLANFEYTIQGGGQLFLAGSIDTAFVDVEVLEDGPPQVQLIDQTTSLPFIEGAFLYVGSAAIASRDAIAILGQLGEASMCAAVTPGRDVPIEVEILGVATLNPTGVCTELLDGSRYTVRIVDGPFGTTEITCDEGIADPVACAGP